MDYQALVVPELRPAMIQTGEALIRALDNAGIPVPAAFWLRTTDVFDWRLVLASPIVDKSGRGGFYHVLVPHVLALKSHDVTPGNVVAASPSDPTVVALSRYLGAEPGINSIRLTGNVVGGIFVPDAHVYRLA